MDFHSTLSLVVGNLIAFSVVGSMPASGQLIHDAEHYILAAQHGRQWAAEDKQIDPKLAAFRAGNGGKPPNIVYILFDDWL